MNPVSRAELKRYAPHARDDYVDAIINGWPEIERAGVNTPARFVRFIGQCAAETGYFTIVRENTSWTPKQFCALWPKRYKTALDPRILACSGDKVKLANLAYANRADIGNKGGNDGWDFRGGSFLQATGRAMFEDLERATGYQLTSQPELIERADVGLKAALWVWSKHNCNALADRGYTVAIGNAINRGSAYSSALPIGHEMRLKCTERAEAVFGDNQPLLPGLALGARGAEVEVLQRRLKELNYGIGKVDGAFGLTTSRAVAAFKQDQRRAGHLDLETDEIIGPKVWAVLNVAAPVEHPDREKLTTKEATKVLAEAGSETVAAGKRQKAAGNLVVVASAAKGVQEAGGLDAAKEALGVLPQWHSLMLPVIDAVKWGLGNAFWAGTMLLGVWVWSGGHKTLVARARDHINGFNLFR